MNWKHVVRGKEAVRDDTRTRCVMYSGRCDAVWAATCVYVSESHSFKLDLIGVRRRAPMDEIVAARRTRNDGRFGVFNLKVLNRVHICY